MIKKMESQCQFVFCCREFRGERCKIILNDTHAFCRFHGSIDQRNIQGMRIPRWTAAHQPSQDDSTKTYQEYYHDLDEELDIITKLVMIQI